MFDVERVVAQFRCARIDMQEDRLSVCLAGENRPLTFDPEVSVRQAKTVVQGSGVQEQIGEQGGPPRVEAQAEVATDDLVSHGPGRPVEERGFVSDADAVRRSNQ